MPKPYVRNLGVILDSELTMQAQIAQIPKFCYHQIRNIGQIRSSITGDACKTLVHACSFTPRLRECAAIRPSADNAAAFATCAKLRSSTVLENTTTSRQCYSICTGYRFECARHTHCLCLLIRLCMTKHRVTSRNYYHVVNPIAD